MKYRKDNPETTDTMNRNRVEKMGNGGGIKGMEEIVTLLSTLFCIFLSFGTIPVFHVCKKKFIKLEGKKRKQKWAKTETNELNWISKELHNYLWFGVGATFELLNTVFALYGLKAEDPETS